MVNRLADRILSAVLPKAEAAAPCSPWVTDFCYCSGGRLYTRQCRDCTGAGGGCTSCRNAGTC